MDKKIGSEHEPSPELMQAFSELVDREAHRQQLLDSMGRPQAVNCMAWQPMFVMEDFHCVLGTGCSEKPAGKSSAAAGANNGVREKERGREARKDIKRTREVSSHVVDGEEVRKKKTAREMKNWDLNKRVELLDDNS